MKRWVSEAWLLVQLESVQIVEKDNQEPLEILDRTLREDERSSVLQKLAKPYRLKAVSVAIIGFGLLRFDVSSALLLAV